VLNWCERKILLAGWQPASRTRRLFMYCSIIVHWASYFPPK
jgi:hypothetical protein